MRRNQKWILCMCLAMALLLSACGGSGGGAGGGKEAGSNPDGGGSGGGEQDVLTVALASEPTGLVGSQVNNLVSNTPICNIAEGLITVTPDGEYVPLLAESYEQVDDVTYRFHLKQGIQFHNGEEMKAEDVVYSLHAAAISPQVKHASAMIDPEGFEIEDDYTVLIRTVSPYAPIIACLSHSANSIVCKSAWEAAGDDFIRSPVGTGPYRFVKWTSGESVELTRFDGYHGEPAKTKDLIFRIIPEAASRVVELETGGVDVIGDVPVNDLSRFEESPDQFTVYGKPGMRIYPVILNQQSEFFDDVRVRQAMRYATNSKDIISVVWNGLATDVSTVMPPAVMGYTEDVTRYPTDVEKARALLAEAGYPDGFTCTLITSEASANVKIAEIIQAQWAQAGVTVNIDQMDNAAWLTKQNGMEFDVTVCPTSNSVGDPDANFTKMFRSDNVGPAGNYSGYQNPQVDELIISACGSGDRQERIALYEQIQKILADDAVWVPVGVPDLQVATRACVQGFDLYANNTQRYQNVYKA